MFEIDFMRFSQSCAVYSLLKCILDKNLPIWNHQCLSLVTLFRNKNDLSTTNYFSVNYRSYWPWYIVKFPKWEIWTPSMFFRSPPTMFLDLTPRMTRLPGTNKDYVGILNFDSYASCLKSFETVYTVFDIANYDVYCPSKRYCDLWSWSKSSSLDITLRMQRVLLSFIVRTEYSSWHVPHWLHKSQSLFVYTSGVWPRKHLIYELFSALSRVHYWCLLHCNKCTK